MTTAEQDVLEALRTLCEGGEFSGPVRLVAERAGVHKVTCVRALQALEGLNKIERSGGQRKVCTYKVLAGSRPENDTTGYQIQRGFVKSDECKPGREYNKLLDEELARQDRAVFCARRGVGPAWLQDLGRSILLAKETSCG